MYALATYKLMGWWQITIEIIFTHIPAAHTDSSDLSPIGVCK